ncbi:ABC transporter permease [Halomonas daqingensis]|uniref:Transport permease protein n=1 Tax=Billgrantia desiderata TaxID=52021 RepID=A0AAW4YRV3_9GAMM|nr:ABC transporter permease [Halomonas desiderata]MCE8014239.1 ABC transporter permease [Halomonas desiderata]MCE8050710.1 ABC transporter permease [Halomonas desiderata]
MSDMLKGLWAYRGFVLSSIKNEFVTRFARSKLGGFWMILQPLAQVLIYALILSAVLSAKLPGIDSRYAYAIYLTAGFLGWMLFSEIINRCLNLFIEQGNLMKKMKFPKITLPTIVVGSALLNNVMLLLAILGVFAVLGHFPTLQILWLPVLTLAMVSLALGLGLVLGILNVFIRDIGQAVPILLQVAFWFTPIVYPINIIPERLQQLLVLNPIYPIIRGYHDVLVFGQAPHLGQVILIMTVGFLILAFGLFLFRRASAEMVDAL